MPLNINYRMTDLPSSRSAYNQMLKTNRAIDQTIEVVTTKFRINDAADDAAGLSVSEKMRAQISGLAQAMRNTQDGLSMLQTASDGMSDISSIIQRMRELAVQSANGTLTSSDRDILQSEYSKIRDEIDRITDTTQFNNKKLLNGNASALWSSSDLSTYVIVNGAISGLDENGEKYSAEGNYNLTIQAKAGQAEVQKTAQLHHIYDAEVNTVCEVEGTGIYYDTNGDVITLEQAVRNFGFASWVYPTTGTQDGTTYRFQLIETDEETGAEHTVDFQATIYSQDFDNPKGFVNFMNSEGENGNSTLYGTGYTAYYNVKTGKLGIRSDHDFTVNDRAGGFQRLFGSFLDPSVGSGIMLGGSAGGNSALPEDYTPEAVSAFAYNNALPDNEALYTTAGASGLTLSSDEFLPNVGADPDGDFDLATMSGNVNITSGGNYRIHGTGNREINIAAGVTATIELDNISMYNKAITIGAGANVTFKLTGTNILDGNTRSMTLGQGANLTIESDNDRNSLTSIIRTNGNNTINITGGTVKATAGTIAGIQVGSTSTINISGGVVDVQGGSGSAGIGGNNGEESGTINITGGTVTAKGGSSGAGIGGGSSGNGGTITISSSATVNATGGSNAAGIGSGNAAMSGGTISISSNANVSATGGSNAAGIGGGNETASGGTITISGGTVRAVSGSQGAGIGGGSISRADGKLTRNTSVTATAGTITISGGSVTATAVGSTYTGAGIGGGRHMDGGNITITGGTVNATSSGSSEGNGAGIGGGSGGSGGNISISGGDVRATSSGPRGAGIGSGSSRGDSSHATAGNINISGNAVVTARGGTYGAGIGTGQYGEGGTVNISGGIVSSRGGEYGAGIGSGNISDGVNITITNGKVESSGGRYGAGIGGGASSNSGTITITGGDVAAIAGQAAAAIGGGLGGTVDENSIRIQDGLYYGDNTGFVKAYDSSRNISYIGTTSYVLVGSDILTDSGHFNEIIPAGATALLDVKLNAVNSFYTDDGAFLLDTPQTITITQGDGKSASLTVYGEDTVGDLLDRIHNAIAYDLGQAKYIEALNEYDSMRFAAYVENDGIHENTQESFEGSVVIRSAIAGKAGTLRFSGSEEMLKNLGLNTIQEARENEFTVSIKNAHTNETLSTGGKITSNRIAGAISPNIDIEFDTMAGISALWNDHAKKFTLASHTYSTTIHLTDNSSNLQVGANENERINFTISDMSSKALKLDTTDIADRERAAEALTTLDNALDKVSMQNAKTGALISRLGKTIEVIATMEEHVTESESKIRDADMAKATMTLTQLQMMLNAQTSVLSQSNQTANNILSIIR